jgi:hypothetical protein
MLVVLAMNQEDIVLNSASQRKSAHAVKFVTKELVLMNAIKKNVHQVNYVNKTCALIVVEVMPIVQMICRALKASVKIHVKPVQFVVKIHFVV